MQNYTLPLGQHAIPTLGFGTYQIKKDAIESAVTTALQNGYTHIDTAEGYKNEDGVGRSLHRFLKDTGKSRDDFFITTKLWPGRPGGRAPCKDYQSTLQSADKSLKRLKLDHVDLYLIHAPIAKEQRLEQWRAMLELKRLGKVREVGVSNYSELHLNEIKNAQMELPAANQIELHPWSQKQSLVDHLKQHAICPIAYSSLVPLATWRAHEGQRSAKTQAMTQEGERETFPFAEMAKGYGVTQAQVLLRWGTQKGYAVLPKSVQSGRIKENAQLFGFELSDADMQKIDGMDRGPGLAWGAGDPTLSP